jgi:hypothetical protein
MPSVSRDQQRFMGAAYARKKAGHPRADDPDMSVSQLRDFAATKRSTLPQRAPHKGSYGGRPAKEST